MLSRLSLTVLISLLSIPFLTAQSQSQQPPPPPADRPYTIRTISRVVLTDVTVTDSKGNPVHGLLESAFQIFDNKKPQTIATFEEHSGTAGATTMEPVTAAKGVYSNDYLKHLPSVLNVIIIDIANLDVPDQMYLYSELTRFFNLRGDTSYIERAKLADYTRVESVYEPHFVGNSSSSSTTL